MKLGVFIGRFQPFHRGHLHVVREALKSVDRLLILVGSASEPRTTFNPWTFTERTDMILSALDEAGVPDVVDIRSLDDFTYNDAGWCREVQRQVAEHVENLSYGQGIDIAEVHLVGHKKDGTGFYLDLFPQWRSLGIESYGDGLSATTLREEFFTESLVLRVDDVGGAVSAWCENWITARPEAYGNLQAEFLHAALYREQFAGLPYPPTFITTDVVVVQSGHVLQVKRGNFPGKGLWALPGGFVEAKLRLVDNAIAELIQETSIDEPIHHLHHCIVASRVFDAVYRSARGRTVTHVFLIHLPGGELPRVRAADDAAEVRWLPLSELNRSEMFEDHFHITGKMLGFMDR